MDLLETINVSYSAQGMIDWTKNGETIIDMMSIQQRRVHNMAQLNFSTNVLNNDILNIVADFLPAEPTKFDELINTQSIETPVHRLIVRYQSTDFISILERLSDDTQEFTEKKDRIRDDPDSDFKIGKEVELSHVIDYFDGQISTNFVSLQMKSMYKLYRLVFVCSKFSFLINKN